MIVLILRLPVVIFPPSLTCSKLIVILHLIKQFVTFMFPMMQIVIPTKCWISTLFFISLGTDNKLSIEKLSVHKIYAKLCFLIFIFNNFHHLFPHLFQVDCWTSCLGVNICHSDSTWIL